jgi:Na+/proline symporter
MTPYLACGSAAAGICFVVAVWRLNASRSPDQAYRAAAIAGISGFLIVCLTLIWLVLKTTRPSA